MNWGMDVTSVTSSPEAGEMSMSMASNVSVEQFVALPDGTEIFAIVIHPFGLGMQVTGLVMDDKNRASARDWATRTENDIMPFQTMVYLLPEGYDVTKEMHTEGNENGNAG